MVVREIPRAMARGIFFVAFKKLARVSLVISEICNPGYGAAIKNLTLFFFFARIYVY